MVWVLVFLVLVWLFSKPQKKRKTELEEIEERCRQTEAILQKISNEISRELTLRVQARKGEVIPVTYKEFRRAHAVVLSRN